MANSCWSSLYSREVEHVPLLEQELQTRGLDIYHNYWDTDFLDKSVLGMELDRSMVNQKYENLKALKPRRWVE